MSRGLSRRLAVLEARAEAAGAASAGFPGGVAAELERRLDALETRMRAAPDWREPTPGEAAEDMAAVRASLAELRGPPRAREGA